MTESGLAKAPTATKYCGPPPVRAASARARSAAEGAFAGLILGISFSGGRIATGLGASVLAASAFAAALAALAGGLAGIFGAEALSSSPGIRTLTGRAELRGSESNTIRRPIHP